MPRISLTDFVDLISKSGTPKATKSKELLERPDYHPSRDYYKIVRDWISETHSQGLPKSHLHKLLPTLTDEKKSANYPTILEGYRKWWGSKQLLWFTPHTTLYSARGIDISVNPELGLQVKNQPHLIKLYFKAEPLTKTKTEIVTHLMEVSLEPIPKPFSA